MVQLFLDVASAFDKAAETFENLEECWYATKALGASGQTEIMSCDCAKSGDEGSLCGDSSNCINRLTSIECVGDRCGCSSHCENRRFQLHQHAKVDVFDAGPKGFGVRALEPIKADGFIYEYTGEVVDQARFLRRKRQYEQQGITHFYFMMLQKDEFIDATVKGSVARFCNHSCAPNAYIDKWVVGPKLRMGLFAKRDIAEGEEITFDYNVDRYGAAAQPCYCGEANCTGWLGGKTQTNGLALPPLVADALGLSIEEEEEWQRQIPKTAKRKDLDAQVAESLPVKEIDLPDVSRLMAALMQLKAEAWLARKLIDRIFITQDQAVHIEVMRMHGYEIFASLLTMHSTEPLLVEKILETLGCWPQMTRNKISSSKIEGVVTEIAQSESEAPSPRAHELAKQLLEAWSSLQMAYRIPRRERESKEISGSPDPKDQKDQKDSKDSEDLKDAKDSKDSKDSKPASSTDPSGEPVRRQKLPAGWEQKVSDSGKTYFVNVKTGEMSDRAPDPRELERQREIERQLAAERELEASRQAALREEREKQAESLEKIIADAIAQGGSDSSPSTRADTPESSRKPPNPAKQYTFLLAKYVPKVVWRYEPQLGRERCKKHAAELVKLLVEKELKRDCEVPTELSDEKKKKIRHFVVPYMEKALLHYLKKAKRTGSESTGDPAAKRQRA